MSSHDFQPYNTPHSKHEYSQHNLANTISKRLAVLAKFYQWQIVFARFLHKFYAGSPASFRQKPQQTSLNDSFKNSKSKSMYICTLLVSLEIHLYVVFTNSD